MRSGLFYLLSCFAITASGQIYSYDSLGRIKTVLYADSSTIHYSYDPNGNRISAISNPCFTKPKAVITATKNLTICEGDSIILKADSAFSYKWSTGATARSISVKTAATVELFIINEKGCKDSTKVVVAVSSLPTITIQQTPSVVCAGSSITLTASGANTYSWSGSGMATMAGATVTVTPTAFGVVYSVSGTSTAGCVAKKDIAITLTNQVTPRANISSSGCQGNSVTFTASPLNGGTTPAIQWQTRRTATSPWSDSVGQTNSTFIITNVPLGTQVRYKLTSTASCVTTPIVFSDSSIINCVVTAIPIIDGMERFIISPNPNKGAFSVQMKFNIITPVAFKVVNETGQVVHAIRSKNVFGAYTQHIRIPQPMSGTYYLVSTVRKTTFAEKIIVVR